MTSEGSITSYDNERDVQALFGGVGESDLPPVTTDSFPGVTVAAVAAPVSFCPARGQRLAADWSRQPD